MSKVRLIDANALKEEMNKKALDLANGGMIFIDNINKAIDNAPTVEPFEPDYVGAERLKARQRGYEDGYHNGMEIGKTLNPKIKQGEWNYIQAGICVCPFCGAIPHKLYKDYCAKCGADMKGGADMRGEAE